ncbi:MAG: FKBP-type peptidyl-prolyl cis-trans isomerase [Chlamydiia bacterium]|nr:FKBP-type peptidyl-prolyl cis-trans isomerase [Chlamydiia bacterium]
MKNLVFLCLIVFVLVAPGGCSSPTKSQECNKNKQSEELLTIFWKELFQTTSAGYAIYGEKPLYLGNFCHPEWLMPGSPEHQEANRCFLALQILESYFKQNAHPANCILINRGKSFLYPYEFMIINKKSFYERINENASLFKYKFGWKTSPESVLEDLISTDNSFLTLLRKELALQGILLGYGAENAISYERNSPIFNSFTSADPVHPFKKLPPLPEEITEELEESYASKNPFWKKIREETEDFAPHCLQNREEGLNIFFSFHKNCEKNRFLLEGYRKAQAKINTLFHEETFLENVLENFGVNNKSHTPYEMKIAQKFTDRDKKMLSLALARVISYAFSEQISPEFFKGIECADKIQEETFNSEELLCFDVLREQGFSMELRRENASLSREFLLKEAAIKKMRCLIPEKLYTLTLKHSQGKTLTFNDQTVLVNYLIKDFEGSTICGTYKREPPEILDLGSVTPGLAHGMLGMVEGEVREIYIHPDLAYGVYSNFGKGKAIVVQLELVKIETATNHTQFPYLQPVDVRHFSPEIQTCEAFNKLQEKHNFSCGMRVWSHYKKARDLLDLDTIMTQLQSKQLQTPSEEERELIARLNAMIYNGRTE